MFAFDKRLEVRLKSAHSLAPFFNPFRYVGRKLRMEKKGADKFVTVELWFEHKKASPRDCLFNTLPY